MLKSCLRSHFDGHHKLTGPLHQPYIFRFSSRFSVCDLSVLAILSQ
jgi:hypothetical protein